MHWITQVGLLLTVKLIFVIALRVAISGSYRGLNSLFAISYLSSLGVMSIEEQKIFYQVQLPAQDLETKTVKKESLWERVMIN